MHGLNLRFLIFSKNLKKYANKLGKIIQMNVLKKKVKKIKKQQIKHILNIE